MGADVNARDNYAQTPLYEAVQLGHKDVAALLIQNGADVNAKTYHDGPTPLHWAAYLGHKDLVALLMENGADVNAKDKVGKTPLDVAGEEIRELLKQASRGQ